MQQQGQDNSQYSDILAQQLKASLEQAVNALDLVAVQQVLSNSYSSTNDAQKAVVKKVFVDAFAAMATSGDRVDERMAIIGALNSTIGEPMEERQFKRVLETAVNNLNLVAVQKILQTSYIPTNQGHKSAIQSVFTEMVSAAVTSDDRAQDRLDIIEELNRKIDETMFVNIGSDVEVEIEANVSLERLRNGVNLAKNEYAKFNSSDIEDDIGGNRQSQVNRRSQGVVQAQIASWEERSGVLIGRAEVKLQVPKLARQQPRAQQEPDNLPPVPDNSLQSQQFDDQQSSDNQDVLNNLPPPIQQQANTQANQAQPVIPPARQPTAPDTTSELARKITQLQRAGEAFLTREQLAAGGDVNAIKTVITKRLLNSMSPGLGDSFNFNGTDAYTAMVNRKVDALYKRFYDGNAFKPGVTADDIVSQVEGAIHEERSQVLLQAYMSRGSLRPVDVRADPVKQRYKDRAVDSQYVADEIKDALAFEYRRSSETPYFESPAQVGSSIYRLLSGPPAFLARGPGNLADKITDYILNNKASSAAMAVLGYIAVCTFLPGALPFALMFGVPALVGIGIIKGISKIAEHPVGEAILKMLALPVLLPLDAVATGLSAGLAALAAVITTAFNGKSFVENFNDSLMYDPFSASRKFKEGSADIAPVKKEFKNAYKEHTAAKTALDGELLGLTGQEMATALGNGVVSDYVLNSGKLATNVLGRKEVTDALGQQGTEAKLREFLDKNPPKEQVETMLAGNPGLVGVIDGKPELANHQAMNGVTRPQNIQNLANLGANLNAPPNPQVNQQQGHVANLGQSQNNGIGLG